MAEVQIIGVCGLICSECEAYKATQADDDALRAEVARKWSEEYGGSLVIADINCDGCVAEGIKFSHCAECKMRECAAERGLPNCAHCDDYETCEKIAGFFEMVPPAKQTLDAIRAAL
jgi:hypothetical protein